RLQILSSSFRCTHFFFNHSSPPETYTLSLHDALPIFMRGRRGSRNADLSLSAPARSPSVLPARERGGRIEGGALLVPRCAAAPDRQSVLGRRGGDRGRRGPPRLRRSSRGRARGAAALPAGGGSHAPPILRRADRLL